MQLEDFNQKFMSFLKNSPTPFHATQNMGSALSHAGFTRLEESEAWSLKAGGKYWVSRNGSSILAFTLSLRNYATEGFAMAGAHTDSPCLRLKPNAFKKSGDLAQLGTEIYGGVLLQTWFDRDLSIAGRVHLQGKKGSISSQLLNFISPILTVPSLAIHLFRGVHENRSLNAQKELVPVLLQENRRQNPNTFEKLLESELENQGLLDGGEVLSHELYCYDTQDPAPLGYHREFIASARLDNLLSCWASLQALLHAKGKKNLLLVANDHEEIGSKTAIGADGTFLKDVLARVTQSHENLARSMAKSLMVSCDNAHAIHPNYPEKHDPEHGPIMNAGPVLKVNANQRYASNSATMAAIKRIAQDLKIPLQKFVSRSDMPCGSTIGPLTASRLGIPTVDLGVPTWAMHSIREIAGREDTFSLFKILQELFSGDHSISAS